MQSTGTTTLPSDVAEELVLTAAREGFYAAGSLDSPAVSQAQQCLALLPDSAAAKAELGAISALLRLQREHGYAMLPAAFKQVVSSNSLRDTEWMMPCHDAKHPTVICSVCSNNIRHFSITALLTLN